MLDLDTILSSFTAQGLQGKQRACSEAGASRQSAVTSAVLLPAPSGAPRAARQSRQCTSGQTGHFSPCLALYSKISRQFNCCLYLVISKISIQSSKCFAALNETAPLSALPEGCRGWLSPFSRGHKVSRGHGRHRCNGMLPVVLETFSPQNLETQYNSFEVLKKHRPVRV